jgi:hypothetical protein
MNLVETFLLIAGGYDDDDDDDDISLWSFMSMLTITNITSGTYKLDA